MQRFLLTNFLLAAVIAGIVALHLLSFIWQMPTAELGIGGFLLFLWALGIVFAVLGRWRTVYHIANGLPVWGLVGCVLTVVATASRVTNLTPETAVEVFRGVAFGLICTGTGAFGFLWLRELAYFVGEEHI